MRIMRLVPVVAGIIALTASAASAGTTRIETRPFYGAVVTIEEGVRVFRPLPSTDRVIINPHGKTPLSLGFNETYVTERNYNYNYSETSDGHGGGYYGSGGFFGGFGGHGGHLGGHGKGFKNGRRPHVGGAPISRSPGFGGVGGGRKH